MRIVMEIILSLLYIFHQFFDSNIDLFYVFFVFVIIKELFLSKKKMRFRLFIFIYFLILYAALQIFSLEYVNLTKLVVYIFKFSINIYILIYLIEKNYLLKKLSKISYIISAFYLILLPISLAFKSELLWRLNDIANIYAKNRLKYFYVEPSELSFHISIIIIVLFNLFFYQKNFKSRIITFLFILTNSIILFMSAGLGGMIYLLISLFILISLYIMKHMSNKVIFVSLLILCLIILSGVLGDLQNSGFFQRVTDIVNGKDSSTSYRFNTSFTVMKEMLKDTYGVGVGFGNLNTDYIRNKFSAYGLVDVISNSFMYFIAEGGIICLIALILFITLLINKIKFTSITFQLPMLLFILLYQIGGGYFTNPINWIIYGVIWTYPYNKNISNLRMR